MRLPPATWCHFAQQLQLSPTHRGTGSGTGTGTGSGSGSGSGTEWFEIAVTTPIPPFITPLLHSFYLQQRGGTRGEDWSWSPVPLSLHSNMHHFTYPAVAPAATAATSACSWEWTFTARADMQYRATFHAEVDLPKREEHAADPARGREVPPTFIRVAAKVTEEGEGVQKEVLLLQTQPVLIRVPIPDFSMPFNVLTLGSTALAFLAGLTVNTLFTPHIPASSSR